MTTRTHALAREIAAVAASLTVLLAGCATGGGARAAAAAPPAGAPPASPPASAAVPAAPPSAAIAATAAPADPTAATTAAAPAREKTLASLRIPLFDDAFADTPVARVDDEVITVAEIVDAMAMTHEGAEAKGSAGKRDVLAVLDRLIDLRLFVVEARDMKLDELPEVKKTIADFERTTAREILKRRAVSGVTPDAAFVDSKYKEATREWKVKSVLFHFEVDAKDMKKQLAAGKPFDELVQAAKDQNQVKTVSAGEFLPVGSMLPHVRAALEKAKVGEVTPPLPVPGGFALLAVEEIRHRDDPMVKAAAESASVTNRSYTTLRKYYEALVKKHAKYDKKAIDALDLAAPKPGLAALAKSTRPLVTIRGEKPLTVGDFVAEIQKKFFHGVESAVKEKRINQEKWTVFDQVLFRRLLDKEAALQRIGDDREYRTQVTTFTREQLFSAFMGRALLPEVKVPAEDVRAYYDQHAGDFSYPRFIKLESIAFDSAAAAQAALDTLRAGNDMKWVREHAEGRADESRLAYKFDKTLSSKAIPAELLALIEGAKKGDLRLFAADDGKYYVLRLAEDTPPEKRPFDDAKAEIAKKLFGEKTSVTLKEWAAKLRAGHDVEVFIQRIGG